MFLLREKVIKGRYRQSDYTQLRACVLRENPVSGQPLLANAMYYIWVHNFLLNTKCMIWCRFNQLQVNLWMKNYLKQFASIIVYLKHNIFAIYKRKIKLKSLYIAYTLFSNMVNLLGYVFGRNKHSDQTLSKSERSVNIIYKIYRETWNKFNFCQRQNNNDIKVWFQLS